MQTPFIPTFQPTLESARLRLREFRDSDTDALFAVHSDARVMRYWSYPAWTQRQQAVDKVADIQRQRRELDLHVWAIADRDSDGLIGSTALFSIDREQQRGEIGYSLHPDWQGHGLAQEALELVLAFAFDQAGLERIEADTDPRNTSSRQLLEKLGFRCEGLLRERWRVNGEICDSAMYGLLRREFVRA